MNEDLKKAYFLVEQDLRTRAEGSQTMVSLMIFPLTPFNSVRVEIAGQSEWAGTIVKALEQVK